MKSRIFVVGKTQAMFGAEAARRSAAMIARELPFETPEVAIVLGSGLGGLASRVESAVEIPFRRIEGIPTPTVEGHRGALLAGRLGGRRAVVLAGRIHMYEGHDARAAGYLTRVVHALGARVLVISNAAGGVNRSFDPGDLMLIQDHINLMFRNPLIGDVEEGDSRFPDMSNAYDVGLRRRVQRVAARLGIDLREGVYAGLLGPAYETAAEVRMLSVLGADAVGMSTIPEVIVANALGLPVLGISCITNLACGLSNTRINHADVLATTSAAAARFERLVLATVEDLPELG